ncbi:tetracycline efflux MFS transporter Tet(V) [Gordonia sinesedis]
MTTDDVTRAEGAVAAGQSPPQPGGSGRGERLPRALRPFGVGQYRLLLAGLVFAMFADGAWMVALVWQVIALGGGPGQVSVATSIGAIGIVVSTLGGGVLADRVSQRSIIIGLETVKMITFGLVGIASLAGVLTLPMVVVAALFGGVTIGMYYPAYSALLPRLIAASELQAANGIEGFLRPVVYQAAGPMVAGAVIGAVAPGPAIVCAAVASIASGICYLAMKPVVRERDGDADGSGARSVVADLGEGFAYLWRTPWLWATLFFATVLVLMVVGPLEVLVPFLLRDRIDGDAGDHALVLAGFGVGSAIGALVFASIPMPRRYMTVLFAIWGWSSVPLVIMAVADRTWLFVVAGVVLGMALDAPMVLWGTLLQRRVPKHLLGRVASLDFFVSVALMPVSMAIAAPVADAIGLTATFVLAGLLPVPVAAAFYVAARLWRDEVAHPLR